MSRVIPLMAVALAALLANAAPSFAQTPAAPDSLLDDYLGRMRDSTDVWFGMSAAPLDTTGLDSALVGGLARGSDSNAAARARRAGRITFSPSLAFTRVDGGVVGAEASVGSARLLGRLNGTLEYALAAEEWLGGVAYAKRWTKPYEDGAWVLRGSASRRTDSFDRDHFNPQFAYVSAFLGGGDRNTYLTRTGVDALLERLTSGWSLFAGIRDHAEHARVTSTEWTVLGVGPDPLLNAPAAEGRAREARFGGRLSLPRLPWTLEAQHWTSGRQLASDFTYRRTRVAVAGDIGLFDRVALVPQFEWGRLKGDALPQQAFYMGGTPNLRTYDRNERVGSGRAVMQADLLYVGDALTRLGVPHPAWLPLSFGVFGNVGAVWGIDPVTGLAAASDRAWPDSGDWKSEAGIMMLWRIGVPDPDAAVRFDYAVPVGPEDERVPSFTISFQKSLGMLRVR